MDKIKAALAWLKRHHFWVLACLGVLVTLIVWVFATSTLSKAYTVNKSKVQGEFERVQTIMRTDDLKNDFINKNLNDQLATVAQDVLNAWKLHYDEQTRVLRWPVGLGPKFNDFMQALPLDQEIPSEYRDDYAPQIVRFEFPRLVEIAQARHFEDEKKQDLQARMADHRRTEPIVKWSTANQSVIHQRFDWVQKVSTREVRAAQEDLWAYQAMLGIVAKVNAGATGHYNAKVKVIELIAAGPPAGLTFLDALTPGRILIPSDAPPGISPKPIPERSANTEGAAIPTLDSRRYADEYGRPLPEQNSPMPIEYRRLPVHFRFMMDQREISSLLAECVRAPLPLEVRQLRLEPRSIAKGSRPPAAGGQGIAVNERPQEADKEKAIERGPFDVLVEVFGFIYFYNPPDRAKLGLPAVAPQTAGASGEGPAPAVAAAPAS